MPRVESDRFISYPLIEGQALFPRDLSEEDHSARLANDYSAFFDSVHSRLNYLILTLCNRGQTQRDLHELGLDLPVELA